MFKFIENAVADHRIRKIESELERDNAAFIIIELCPWAIFMSLTQL